MKGLWNLPTTPINPGLSVLIFDSLVAYIVVIFTCIAIARRSKHWPEAWSLHVGMLLLSVWFVLHWIDVMIHYNLVSVTYGYILVDCFYNIFRVFSDIFVLWGTWRVLIRYECLRPSLEKTSSFITTTATGGLLWFLGLYHLYLLFALSFAWLSFSDLNVINAIAKARSGFEIAFTALQFVSTAFTALWAIANYGIRPANSPYEKEAWASVPASFSLLIRSFCEVVIVGQLDRWPADIQTIAQARDITYGLFSMFFVGFITFAIPQNSVEDPLVKREEDAVGEVTTWIICRLAAVTEQGRKTAPTIPALLESLEATLGPLSRYRRDRYDTSHIKRNEIKRLKALYADWEPIYKWQGESSNSEASRTNDDTSTFRMRSTSPSN